MTHVKVAAGIFPLVVCAVRGNSITRTEIPVRTHHVQGVRIGVTSNHTQAVEISRGQGRLQTIVVRAIDVPHLEDLGQVRKLTKEKTAILFTMAACERILGRRVWIHLIDVPNAYQPRAVISDITDFNREIRSERVLYVEGIG